MVAKLALIFIPTYRIRLDHGIGRLYFQFHALHLETHLALGNNIEKLLERETFAIWGNLTQWREHQDWEEADLKYRALKMVLPADDPNIRYIEKHFNVQRDENVINDVRNRVTAYEDSVRHSYEMYKLALYKDSIANHLLHESKIIRRNYNFAK